ncbi:MAG: hypothetical protein ACREIT_04050, partial [Tepidisphaeraceae bacterium]
VRSSEGTGAGAASTEVAGAISGDVVGEARLADKAVAMLARGSSCEKADSPVRQFAICKFQFAICNDRIARLQIAK